MNFKEKIEEEIDEDPDFERIVKLGENNSKIKHKQVVSSFEKNLKQYSFKEKLDKMGGLGHVKKNLLASVQPMYHDTQAKYASI